MKRKRNNRCAYCGRFATWDNLAIDDFTPDSVFGGEDICYRHTRADQCAYAKHRPGKNPWQLVTGMLPEKDGP